MVELVLTTDQYLLDLHACQMYELEINLEKTWLQNSFQIHNDSISASGQRHNLYKVWKLSLMYRTTVHFAIRIP